MAEVLSFDRVTVEHRGRWSEPVRILDDVSLSIAPGEALGLVGESGCGKSTVALAAMRYLPRGMQVASGRIVFEGQDLAAVPAHGLRQLRGNRIAMIYQDPMSSLNPVMTIGRQLAEVPLLHGETDQAKARARAIAMLGEVRLADPASVMERYPHQLSGGQQQRVVIAMALMAEPALLVMDEPTTGLDVTIEAAILELVRDLRVRFGAAILFISHNLGTVARVCDRVGVLYAGRLVEMGAVAQVFRTPAHPYTRGLLAALPRVTTDGRARQLKPIAGLIAAADRGRIGCAFAPRCAQRVPDHCDGAPIAMRDAGEDGGHVARCARLDQIPAEQTAARAAAPDTVAASAGAPLLNMQGVSKSYATLGMFGGRRGAAVHALTDVTVTARAMQTLAIVGESGCGKSTLARIIAGLTDATSGQVLLGETDLAQLPVDDRPADLRRRVQMVFQNPDSTLNPSHTVEYALMRPLQKLRGLDREAARLEARALAERVRLPAELLNRYPEQLSGGQRQRVAIARALAGNPDLLIADEPVSALDVSVQASVVNLLDELIESNKIGLVMISHDLALVRHMADWVAVMYLGRVVESGPASEIFAGPHHPYTAALLAAAPDPDNPRPGVVLEGAMPSATAIITGCAFASRCPVKIEGLCEAGPPPRRRNGDHMIACHHSEAMLAARPQT